jgi:hypothetical protein
VRFGWFITGLITCDGRQKLYVSSALLLTCCGNHVALQLLLASSLVPLAQSACRQPLGDCRLTFLEAAILILFTYRWCETWTLTLRLFETRLQSRIFGPKTEVQKRVRGFHFISSSIICLPRPYCCYDPSVAMILLLLRSQCCRDPIVVTIPVLPRSYCCYDPNVATILLLL